MADQWRGVLKLDGTWAGTGVSIVASTQEAMTEFRRMSKPPGAGFAAKALAGEQRPALRFGRGVAGRHRASRFRTLFLVALRTP